LPGIDTILIFALQQTVVLGHINQALKTHLFFQTV